MKGAGQMEQVKIAYQFADGHVEELEVEPEIANAIKEMESDEYRNNRRETRRHESMSAMDFEGELFIDPRTDLELSAIQRMDQERFGRAFRMLSTQQQELLYALYFKSPPFSQAEYAAKHGIRETSVKQSAWRSRCLLKKILEEL